MSFPIAATTAADAASNETNRSRDVAPHRKNATLRSRSDSPYQQRRRLRDNSTQLLIKQAVKHLNRQHEVGNGEALTEYLFTLARFHPYSRNVLAVARKRPSVLNGMEDDKLPAFALRLALTDHVYIPRDAEIDHLVEAEKLFAPALAQSSEEAISQSCEEVG